MSHAADAFRPAVAATQKTSAARVGEMIESSVRSHPIAERREARGKRREAKGERQKAKGKRQKAGFAASSGAA